MFSSFMSQPLSIPLQQMESVSDQGSSVLNKLTGMTGPMSTNPSSQFVVSNQQMAASDLVSDSQTMPNQKAGEIGPMWSNVGLQKPLLPIKRKAAAESSSNDSVPQQLSVPNKRVVQMEAHVNSPRVSPVSALNKKNMQVHSMIGSQASVGLSNKRMTRNESISSKTGSPRVQTPRSKTAALEVSPKVQNGSYEAVRLKMRETLAAALSVGNQNKEVPNEDKSAPSEAGNIPMQAHVESQPASTAPMESSESVGKSDGLKPQYNYVMPDTDGSFGDMFFAKDELLQGNGLSWAWDMEVSELKEVETDVKPNPVPTDLGGYGTEQGRCAESGNVNEQVNSPQELAFKIEAELFKLFGGVNKKYKEKGRSLMFNLKDPNNPELREKVLSAKISPERLCSMTPEELASKELSEWRMAKAEELDKMIVLPDSDVDVRRLVKKTHKGEYQVEVEQDDGVSVEVSVGSSSLTRFPPKKKTDHLSEKVVAEGEKSSSEKPDATGGLTVSTDGTDIMQELIVEEFKDEGFLPPIVSLDEFMESLNSEPPFENLPVDAKETKTLSGNDELETCGETGNEKASSAHTSTNPVKGDAQTNDSLSVNPMEERKLLPPLSTSIGECLWEGDLQLTLGSTVSVIGLFRSGEKTSTKEWPGSVEIKGRVRLQAFEKFLQELPMSRSRAVMVVHFALKDASSEFHRSSLSEAVDSYIAEERVGFGEPSAGVEVYFCPSHKRTTEMLCRLLSKDQTDILKTTDDGLIGVVVWRRSHPSSAMLPRRQENINANTNPNKSSKSLRFGHGQSHTDSRQPPQPNEGSGGDGNGDDDDDIPPGFGPGVVARDVDDLPEFSFSGGSNSSRSTIPAQIGSGSRMTQPNPPRPVEHMRQLVYKYGQTGNNINSFPPGTNWNGNGIKSKPWSQEDDDIPEWQPQHQNRQHQEVSVNNIQELSRVRLPNQIRPDMGQNVVPVMAIQQPFNLVQNGWVQPFPPPGLAPNATLPGQQHYGGRWRPDDPRARGF